MRDSILAAGATILNKKRDWQEKYNPGGVFNGPPLRIMHEEDYDPALS
jgi:hypothetical protein